MDCTISSEGKQASGRKQDVGQEAAAKGSEEVFEEVDDIQLHYDGLLWLRYINNLLNGPLMNRAGSFWP